MIDDALRTQQYSVAVLTCNGIFAGHVSRSIMSLYLVRQPKNVYQAVHS
jgi:hypothetical protein